MQYNDINSLIGRKFKIASNELYTIDSCTHNEVLIVCRYNLARVYYKVNQVLNLLNTKFWILVEENVDQYEIF